MIDATQLLLTAMGVVGLLSAVFALLKLRPAEESARELPDLRVARLRNLA